MFRKIIVFSCMIAVAFNCEAARKKKKKAKAYTYTERYILSDYNSDIIIDQNEKDARMAPSSMTKLVTLYVLFEKIKSGEIRLDDTMIVSKKARHTGGSRSWLLEGSSVTVDELIRCIIVHSGNDAAVVIAENISGSVEKFADLMNDTAERLGMKNSHFMNPSGLPDDNHYSSVHDIAIISKQLIKDFPEFYHYFAQKELEVNGIRQANRNSLLWADIGVDGLKTGHTDKAGYGLAASAERDGIRLISVVNGYASSKAREVKTAELLNRGFRSIVTYDIAKSGKPVHYADVWLGKKHVVPLITNKDIKISILKSDLKNMKIFAEYTTPIKAPIESGMKVGSLVVEIGEICKRYDLYAGEDVQELDVLSRSVTALKFMLFGRGG